MDLICNYEILTGTKEALAWMALTLTHRNQSFEWVKVLIRRTGLRQDGLKVSRDAYQCVLHHEYTLTSAP